MERNRIMSAVLLTGLIAGLCLISGNLCLAAGDIKFDNYTVEFNAYQRIDINMGKDNIFTSSFLPVFVALPKDEGRDMQWGDAYNLADYQINASPDGSRTLVTSGTYEKETDKGKVDMNCRINITFHPEGIIDFDCEMENKGIEYKLQEVVRILLPDLSGRGFSYSLADASTRESAFPDVKTAGMHLVDWNQRITSIILQMPNGKPVRIEFDPATSVMAGSNGAAFYGDIFNADYHVRYGEPGSWKVIPANSKRSIKFRIFLSVQKSDK